MSKKDLRRLLPLLAVLALAFAVGCSDDDDPAGPGGGGDETPAFVGPEAYEVPNSMVTSAIPDAQLAVGYATQVNLVSTYGAFLNSPAKAAADGPPWVDTFTYGGFTVELTVDEDGDDWTYEARLSGTVGEESYADDLIYRARQAKTGGDGYLDFLDPTTGSWTSYDDQGAETDSGVWP